MTTKKTPQPAQDIEALEQQLQAAKRLLAIKSARKHLAQFIRLMMPDPEAPFDPERSRFVEKPHHTMLIESVERVEKKLIMRFANSIPPQHGKTNILMVHGAPWILGRNPHWNIIIATYGSDYAQEKGGEVREILRNKTFQEIFPECRLRRDSQSKAVLKTTAGGSLTFVGRGEATTGRPADLFIIDDPLKDRVEAESPAILKQLHEWYASVAFTRCHGTAPIVIVHTRWAEDDLIGRLCDPEHSEHDPEKAKKWTYINIPAILDNDDLAYALGKKKGEALWEERFPLPHLREAEDNDRRLFSALYMGRPTPEDGEYFRSDWLMPYGSHRDLPDELRFYCASDHALTRKQENDASVLGTFGVDSKDHIWIMPDLVWDRMETDETLEQMIELMKRYKPMAWFAEDEHINKSLGPFRRRRMMEERIYTPVIPFPSVKDLRARARPIQGRMQMGMVHFPTFAPWWSKARHEILKFPAATHDDFVQFLALIGMGLDREFGAASHKPNDKKVIAVGSIEWIKARSNREKRDRELARASMGM